MCFVCFVVSNLPTRARSRPAVSVLLPVFNAQETLAAAMDSLRAQSFPDFEVVAVDDGSTDGSAAILDAFAARGCADTPPRARHQPARIRVVRQGHLGLVAALNRGLAEARGEFIARMDADDVCHPERLARQLAFLRARPELGLAGCRVAFGGDREKAAGYWRHVEFINSLVEPEEIALSRFRESPFAHPSVMFRRELVEKFGGYREGRFPEDYELWLRWLEAGVRMAKAPETLLTWNDPPGRLSRAHPNYSVESFYAMKCAYLARWLEQHNPHHPEVIVVGAGRITRRRVDSLRRLGISVAAYADIDRRKVGGRLDGAPVIHHDDLPAVGRCFVVPFVGKVGAADYIRALLEARGFVRGVQFIEAA